MASRIPQNFIDDLLDRTDIVELVDARIGLRKSGRNYTGLCPFHQEKTPSFSVSPDKQFYYCFGCGAGGNAIGFLMEFDRLEFRPAVEELAKKAGLEVPQNASPINPDIQKKQNSLFQQLQRAQAYYQQQLREHPQRNRAIDYLKNRGVSGEIAKTFGIGYAPPGWNNLGKTLCATEDDEQQLIQAGMLIVKDERSHTDKKETYDRFRDRIIFPIRDNRGRTIAFGGRVLGDDKPKYLNSPESPVFSKGRELYGLYEARQTNSRLTQLIIVEGYMDVVALAQHDILNTVATLGTATSRDHLTKLFRMVSEVVFCFDGDKAGRQAAERALDNALPVMEDGRQIRFMFLPEGEDPDSIVRKEGKAAFLARIDNALPLPEFFFDSLRQLADIGTLDGKARFSKLALKKLQPMPNGVLRQLMLDQLANLSNLSLDRLLEFAPDEPSPPIDSYVDDKQPHSARSKNNRPQMRRTQNPPRRNVRTPIEWVTLSLLHHPQFVEHLDDYPDLTATDTPGIDLLRELIQLLRANPSLNPGGIIGYWQGSQQQAHQEEIARLAATELPVKDKDRLKVEFLDALKLIASQHQEKALDYLLQKAKTEPLSEQEKKDLGRLLTKKSHLSE
ncbi:MAG: DNA primase [Pseudomonadales bacterium]|nr:DNA primase [Pseudomonadales bacterium]MCP5216254.1 DNA primase [Pseudomonadales bacterium]